MAHAAGTVTVHAADTELAAAMLAGRVDMLAVRVEVTPVAQPAAAADLAAAVMPVAAAMVAAAVTGKVGNFRI
jgi:hypothetical protein